MALASLIISILALAAAMVVALFQLRIARQANALPVMIGLFAEHRSNCLADARKFVYNDLDKIDPTLGLAGIPAAQRDLVRDLAWYYDNLGALVAHGHVDIEPISGYLGGAVLTAWQKMEPFIRAERNLRNPSAADPERWQMYFENLVLLLKQCPPEQARRKLRKWRI